MIPAIGYLMCGADRRRLENAVSLDSQPALIEIDLDCSTGLEMAHHLPNEQLTLHAVSVPAGSADCRTEPALSRLVELAQSSNTRAVVARLEAMPAASIGGRKLSRPQACKAAAADLSRQVEFAQSRLAAVPFYLESKLDAECLKQNSTGKRALRQVLARTGCGWFLDVTALYVEAMNSAQDAYDFLEEVLPSADRVELRISGVFFDEKAECWHASDAHPIPEAVFELYAFVLEVALEKVDAVFVRQDRASADSEIQTVREIAEGISAIV
jgi:uncharacterized protein (UPF0276 family)